MGDKTQLSILLLSSKTTKHFEILFGVLLAFLIVDGIAIAAGAWITTVIPLIYLKIISGSIFILFGLLMLMNKSDDNGEMKCYKNPFVTSFLLILITEWGDKTQIAAALFAVTLNPYYVLIGTMIALTVLSVIAIYFGKVISDRISKQTINKVASVVFIIMGIAFLLL